MTSRSRRAASRRSAISRADVNQNERSCINSKQPTTGEADVRTRPRGLGIPIWPATFDEGAEGGSAPRPRSLGLLLALSAPFPSTSNAQHQRHAVVEGTDHIRAEIHCKGSAGRVVRARTLNSRPTSPGAARGTWSPGTAGVESAGMRARSQTTPARQPKNIFKEGGHRPIPRDEHRLRGSVFTWPQGSIFWLPFPPSGVRSAFMSHRLGRLVDVGGGPRGEATHQPSGKSHRLGRLVDVGGCTRPTSVRSKESHRLGRLVDVGGACSAPKSERPPRRAPG